MNNLSISAVGDISLNGVYLNKTYRKKTPWHKLSKTFQPADLRIGNLESPITNAPQFAPSKLVLRAGETAKDILRNSEFDLLGLANNHAMDFGPTGLKETIAALSNLKIPSVGAGVNSTAATTPHFIDVKGMTVGFLSFCDVDQISPLYADTESPGVAPLNDDSFEITRTVSQQADWMVVQLHWGSELCRLPSPQQRDIARRFVDSGVDLILGHHPHVIQPMEIVQNVPIWYSLGNFSFSRQFWRGTNLAGQRFLGEFRIPRLARNGGIANIKLERNGPPECNLIHTRFSRDGIIKELKSRRTVRSWKRLCLLLGSSSYQEHWIEEEKLAEARRRNQEEYRSLVRRIRLKAYQAGLLK